MSHPSQLIELPGPVTVDGPSIMVDSALQEVPYQMMSSGQAAVLSNLPANGEKTFRLVRGRTPKDYANGVVVTDKTGYYEISNGLTGVRIAKPDRDPKLAPIQGIRLRDGRWAATGPNYLYPSGADLSRLKPLEALSASTRFLERGPLVVTIEVAYKYRRPDLVYGSKLLIPGGDGFYRSVLTVQAGQPSVAILDDTDMDLQYRLDIYAALPANQARYRGHLASRVEFGRYSDGTLYQGNERDAIRELQFAQPAYSSYTTGAFSGYQTIRHVGAWDPWARDTGWYWMLYDRNAPASSPLLGIFAGKASQALGAHFTGPGLYTLPPANGQPAQCGIEFQTNRRGPDNTLLPRARMHWGLFAGTKGSDLGNPDQVTNILRQMNLHGGINLNKVLRYDAQGWNPSGAGLYMTAEATRQVRDRVRTDLAYFRELYSAEPTARDLLDLWRDSTGATARKMAADTAEFSRKMLDALVNGNGIYSELYHYWHGGLEMSRRAIFITELLASDQLTAAEKDKLRASAVFYANLLFDNDFVPMFNGHGLNMGTQNMPVQQIGYRDLYALMMRNHPMMAGRVEVVESNARTLLKTQINEWGAQRGSPHYVEAAMGPVLSEVQQMKAGGGADLFREEPRLGRFGEFYMQLLTPPELRFGGWRKLVSYGDGSTESSELFGQMGTGMAGVDDGLSRRLMGAWRESGKMQSGFHGTTVVKIDERLAGESPKLESATFPGWYTVLRQGWGNGKESAVWSVNGTHYSDHRHQDMGATVMYLLGAPVSIDWGSTYSPQVPGAYQHSLVLPEGAIGQAWDADNTALNGGTMVWEKGVGEELEAFSVSSRMVSRYESKDGGVWKREIQLIHANENYPVVVQRDWFEGTAQQGAKVLTMNLMSEAEVDTPRGKMTAAQRLWDGARQELPSAGTVMYLAAGLNRFGFKGQWAIDWDLYTVSGGQQQALIGNWAHAWHPSREAAEFAKANGRPFQERQNIFRLKGDGPLKVVLLPYRKSAARAGTTVAAGSGSVVITAPGERTVASDTGFTFQSPTRTVLAAFGNQAIALSGVQVAGGPAELVLEGGQARLTVHGAAGPRRFTLPRNWSVPAGMKYDNGAYVLNYKGGSPSTVALK
ncbi:MAG: hypothetical protein U0Q16_02350 [Bryobacteraceae bacterium]